MPKKWELESVEKSPAKAKAVAGEMNYMASTPNIIFGKPTYKYRYKAVGNKVYVKDYGKIKEVM